MANLSWDELSPTPPGAVSWDSLSSTPPAPDDSGDFVRGAKVAAGQMLPLARGAIGLVGATAEKALGEGGISTAVKDWGLKGYQEGMARVQPLSKDTDELTTAWDRAKQGDLGALVDWAQYGLGYGAAQLAAAGATSVAGGLVGTAIGGPVGGAAGAVEGAVAQGAIRTAAQRAIAGLVEKEAARIAATETGAKLAADQVTRVATANVAKTIGQTTALGGYAGVQEAGSIYPEAEEQATKEGRQLDGADLARVWATTAGAAALEGLSDKLGLDVLAGKVRMPGKGGVVARGVTGGLAVATGEAGTEGLQTVLERIGAGKEVGSDEGVKDIINSAGLGAIGGAPLGLVGGAMHRPPAAPGAAPAGNPVDAALDAGNEQLKQAVNTYVRGPGPAEIQAAVLDPNVDLDGMIETVNASADASSSLLTAASGVRETRRQGAQLTEAMDRQMELTAEQNAAGTTFEQENVAAQAATALGQANPAMPDAPPAVALTRPTDERTAKGYLTALREEEAQAGGDPSLVQVGPHPTLPNRFAVLRTQPAAVAPAPGGPTAEEKKARPIVEGVTQNKIESAALTGTIANRKAEDAPRQVVLSQALKNIEERGGVASPEEAQIVAEAGVGKPYDRIDPTLSRQLTTDEKLTQATGIALDKAPRSNTRQTPGPAESEQVAAENNARSDSRMQGLAAQKAAAAAAPAPGPIVPTSPPMTSVMRALLTAPFRRSAEQKATLAAARSTYSVDDMRVLEAGVNNPSSLSATDKLRLRTMQETKKSEPRRENKWQVTDDNLTEEAAERIRAQREKSWEGYEFKIVPSQFHENGTYQLESRKLSADRGDSANAETSGKAGVEPAPVQDVEQVRTVAPESLPQQSKAKPGEMSRQKHDFIKQIARVFGKKVVVFESDDARFADGFVKTNDSKTIYLNKDSDRAHLVVFGHELMHQLKAENPAAYEAIRSVLKIREQEKFKDAAGIKGDAEELISDLQGDMFADTAFWADVFRSVAKTSGNKAAMQLGARIMRSVKSFIRALQGVKTFDSAAMVENMAEVRDAVTKALASYAVTQRDEAVAQDRADNVQVPEQYTSDERVQNSDKNGPPTKREMATRRARLEMGDKPSAKRDAEGQQYDLTDETDVLPRGDSAAAGDDGADGRGPARHAFNGDAVHFSREPRATLDGRYHGAGLKGAEAERLSQAKDARIKERVYFYVDEGSGIRPEAGVGGVPHRVSLSNLYNVQGDPLKLFKSSDLNGSESRVLDAGYDGYYFPNYANKQGTAIVMGPASRGMQATVIDRPNSALPAEAVTRPYRHGLLSREINALDLAAVQRVAPSARINSGTFQVDMAELPAARAAAAEQGVTLPEMKASTKRSPLAASVDRDEAAARIGRRLKRAEGVGAPKNGRVVLTAEGRRYVVGAPTFQDWKDKAETQLPGEQLKDARAWYSQLHDFLTPIYGDDAPRYALAWLLSQKNESPSGGMRNVLRATDIANGRLKIKTAGLNEAALVQAIRGERVDAGVGAKLMDFVDSELGLSRRTWMNYARRGRQPAAIDVWAYRDIGFVDDTVKTFLAKTFGERAVRRLEVDTSYGETNYEYGIDYYNDLVDALNEEGYDGGEWTAREVQAVGWVAAQRAMGIEAEFVRDIVDANTRRVSIGLAPGTGSPLAGVMVGREIPTSRAVEIVNELAQKSGVKVLSSEIGVGAYMTDVEGAIQVNAFASPEAVRDFMDMLGYALQQTEMIATRPLKSGKNSAIDFYSPAFGDLETARKWFAKFLEFQGDDPIAPGFQQVVQDGLPGLRLLNFAGRWSESKVEALVNTALMAAEETGVEIENSIDSNTNLESTKNDWTEQNTGEAYLASLRDRGRLQEAEWLASRYPPSRFDLAEGRPQEAGAAEEGLKKSERREPAGPFYSALSRSIEGISTRAAPAAGWKDAIKGLVNKGAAKQDEVNWSGVNEWLDLQGGKVTKDQVQAYLDANGVKVDELMYGSPAKQYVTVDEDGFINARYDTEDEAREAANAFGLAWDEAANSDKAATKYEGYQLPGGTNYRELLLTLPDPEPSFAVDDFIDKMVEKYGREAIYDVDGATSTIKDSFPAMLSPEDRNAFAAALSEQERSKKDKVPFQSGHWSPKNVLAHVRFNERSDVTGARVLFIEELQSDWGQEGKRKGFAGDNQKTPAMLAREAAEKRLADVKGRIADITGDEAVRTSSMIDYNRRLAEKAGMVDELQQAMEQMWEAQSAPDVWPATTPRAPFVTKTESWLALGLKRVIKYAVDNGFEKVAFVNGDQSADRYDLSKQVNYIQWNPGFSSDPKIARTLVQLETADDKTIGFEVDTPEGGTGVIAEGDFEGKTVEDVLGKEIAQKINASDNGDLRGLDLKVGGEGMKAFYDKIVPTVAKDVVRKLGGGALETVNMTADPNIELDKWVAEDGEGDGSKAPVQQLTQTGFTITDAMRAKAAEGVPLFSEKRVVGASARQYTPQQKTMFERMGRTVEVPTLKERLAAYRKDWAKKWAQGIADQFAPIKELTKDGYMLARLSKGTAGALEAFLHHGKLSLTSDGVYDADRTGGAVERVFQPLQGEGEDFLWWVAANRAERLSAEDRERLFTPADIAAGKSLDKGTTDFDYTLRNGTTTRDRSLIFRDALKNFEEFNRNALDMAEQSGLIDGASRQFWEHEFYVPFYRVSEESGGFIGANIGQALVRQQAFKRLKGGEGKLHSDLLANTLQNWAHLIDASAKNRAAKATLEAAAAQGVAIEAPAATIQSMSGAGGKPVWFMDAGVKRHFLVDDPYLVTAIQSLDFAGMKGPIMNAMSTMKHWLTVGVTASPAFKIRNLIRDSMQAIASSELSYNPVANVIQGYKASDPKGQTYVSALAGGGLIRFGTMLEGRASDRVRQLVKMGVDESTILNSPDKLAHVRNMFEKGFMAYSEIGNRGEEINRAALYEQLIKKGVPAGEAALQARDLMDFSMQGSWEAVRFLSQVVPFFNARIQGMYKLGRSAKDDPQRFATVLGAVAVVSLGLLAAYHDDDDWKKREDWDREGFWWFKVGSMAFRIPKPFEIGAMASVAERAAELVFDKEMTQGRFLKRLKEIAYNNLSMNPVPQLAKPIVDLYANKNSFTGRPIETMGMEKLEPQYRFTGSTSMVARAASTASGGVASPVQIDHMIQGYFGWLGATAVGAADALVRTVSKEPTRPSPDWYKVGSMGFVNELPTGQSRYVTQLYEQSKELEQAYGTWRALLKQGKTEDAMSYFRENRDEIVRYKSLEKVKSAEAKFNEQIRMVERSSMEPDAKKARIRAIQRMKDQAARVVVAR